MGLRVSPLTAPCNSHEQDPVESQMPDCTCDSDELFCPVDGDADFLKIASVLREHFPTIPTPMLKIYAIGIQASQDNARFQ